MNVKSISRLLLIGLILGLSAPAVADVHGVLRVVKGDVQIKSGQSGQVGKARLGQEVYPKDTIVTGKDARAKIVMIDNNEINVSPESNVEIQNYEYNPAANKKDVLLNVLYGKVRSKVEQKYDGKTSKFQVKTPSAVAGVRGTDFVTSYDPATKNSQIVTFRGKVEFGLPGPNGTISNAVAVTPGKSASANGGAPPSQPTNVPKAQLAKMDNESKAEGGSSSQEPRQPAGQDKKGHDGDHHDNSGNQNGSSSNGNSGGAGKDAGAAPQQSSSGNAAPSAPSGGDAPAAAAAPSAPNASGNTAAGDSNSNSGGGAGSSSGGDSSRAPASASGSGSMPASTAAPSGGAAAGGGGGMLQTGDLAGAGAAGNIGNIPTSGGTVTPLVPIAGTAPNTNPLTNCPTCTQIIQGGTSKLIITIK